MAMQPMLKLCFVSLTALTTSFNAYNTPKLPVMNEVRKTGVTF